MFGHKVKTVALAVVAVAFTGAAEPAKIEFKGWFSNPVFSADGKVLVFARLEALPFGARTAPSQLVLWDVNAGKEMRRIDGPADDSLLGPIALAPDGKRLAIGMWNTALRVWDLDAAKEIGRLENSQGAQHPRFAPDGRTLGWTRNDEIYLADATTAKGLQHFGKEANSRINTLALVDDGKTVLTGQSQATDVSGPGAGKMRTFQYQITYWAREAASGKKIRQIGESVTETRKGFGGLPAHDLFVDADGKTVVLAGERSIQVCDRTTGKKTRDVPVTWKLPADDPIRHLTLSADGQVVALVSAKGAIVVWDLTAGKELSRIETGQSIDHVALSPDGKRLAVSHQTPGRVGAVLLIYGL
jgi:WD40 repeat protein